MYEFLDYRVADVMSRATAVRAETTIAEAQAILEKNGWNSLPVVDAAERLLGIVTSLDLLRAFDFPEDTILPRFSDVMRRPVSSVMSRDAQTVCPRTPLTRVLRKLVDTRNKSFPVVEDDRLVGIVAREDLMHALRRAEGEGGRP